MSAADIVLIVDHKWRDLPGLAALAVWLENSFGLNTQLIPYSLWQQSLLEYRPQLLVASILYGQRGRAIVETAHAMGTRVAVIMTEGRPNNFQNMEYSVGRNSGAHQADIWFTWSETVRDYMLEQQVLPEDRIIAAGAHRFDLYCSPLDGLLSSREQFRHKYGLDLKAPLVSWATNFTNAKFHVSNLPFLIKDWTDLGLIKYPAYSNPADFARLDWETRQQTFEVIRKLLRARPQLQLAVKPHPNEDHQVYEEFVQNCRQEFGPRVVFISSEYIWNLLNAADIHLHRLCTTGVEAWFLNVPSIDVHLKDYYAWSRDLPGAAAEAMQGNDVIDNIDHLIERVDYYVGGGHPTAAQLLARERYIKRWLYQVDGKRCYGHARILSQLARERRSIKPFPVGELPWRTRTRFRVNRLLRRPLDASLRLWQKPLRARTDFLGQVDKTITPEDVQLWEQRARFTLKPG